MFHNVAKAEIQYIHTTNCQDNAVSNYTAGSQFERNLDSLLYRTLYVNGGGSISDYAKEGNHFDDVYGLFLCRGYVLAETCQDCIKAATDKIVNDCQHRKEAIIWYDQCLVRYSSTSFNATLKNEPAFCLYNSENLTESENFPEILGNMFSNLTDQATNNPASHMYANAKVNITGIGTFQYSVHQICHHFSIGRSKGRRILTPSCNTRYEMLPFLGDTPLQPPDLGNRTDNESTPGTQSKTLAIAISTALSATLVIVLIGFCISSYRRKKPTEELDDSPGDQLVDLIEDNYLAESFDAENKVESNKFPLIQLNLIQTATQQFSTENKLGEGGFGPVYKGTLVDGKEIAVKRLSRKSGQGLQEELPLVYDYMPNKSLDVPLFDSTMGAQLDWTTRLRIINGIARGILYLHEDSRLRIRYQNLL
ncbi:hypothetical protein POM88_031371 [Heracleum sosnowskyi]|uniref:Cysteine-rich receptor-like protein kinase n=1 Tax=Heracleum sosnowskyi TaxID=360622 RepID=A0AAD8HZD5_9APIA|nr:hypothetical protein POM88_031371 [Heracleum sosnowskyi]